METINMKRKNSYFLFRCPNKIYSINLYKLFMSVVSYTIFVFINFISTYVFDVFNCFFEANYIPDIWGCLLYTSDAADEL